MQGCPSTRKAEHKIRYEWLARTDGLVGLLAPCTEEKLAEFVGRVATESARSSVQQALGGVVAHLGGVEGRWALVSMPYRLLTRSRSRKTREPTERERQGLFAVRPAKRAKKGTSGLATLRIPSYKESTDDRDRYAYRQTRTLTCAECATQNPHDQCALRCATGRRKDECICHKHLYCTDHPKQVGQIVSKARCEECKKRHRCRRSKSKKADRREPTEARPDANLPFTTLKKGMFYTKVDGHSRDIQTWLGPEWYRQQTQTSGQAGTDTERTGLGAEATETNGAQTDSTSTSERGAIVATLAPIPFVRLVRKRQPRSRQTYGMV
jgi:hypothetical protein